MLGFVDFFFDMLNWLLELEMVIKFVDIIFVVLDYLFVYVFYYVDLILKFLFICFLNL